MSNGSVLYVASVPFVGGAEITQLAVIDALLDRGHPVRALLPSEGGLADRLRHRGILVSIAPEPALAWRASRYHTFRQSASAGLALLVPPLAALRSTRTFTDVVYCGGLRAQARTSLAARIAGKRVAWHVHEHYDLAPGIVLYSLRGLANLIVAVSPSVARQSALRTSERTVVVPNDVPATFFRGPTAVRGTKPRIGTVGHLTPLKNHFGFITLVEAVRARFGSIDACIIGRAPYQTRSHADYAARVIRRATDAGIEVRGAEPEAMPDEMQRLDIPVHLSTRPEGFGRAVAEAQASGVPVVAYDWGGVSDLVEHRATGLLVSPLDFNAARDVTIELLRRDALRLRLGEAARDRALRRLRGPSAGSQAAEAIANLCE